MGEDAWSSGDDCVFGGAPVMLASGSRISAPASADHLVCRAVARPRATVGVHGAAAAGPDARRRRTGAARRAGTQCRNAVPDVLPARTLLMPAHRAAHPPHAPGLGNAVPD